MIILSTDNTFFAIQNQDGCSNGLDDFPQEWLAKDGLVYFFDSAQGCCDFFFKRSAGSCKIYQKCDEAEVTTSTTKPSAKNSSSVSS